MKRTDVEEITAGIEQMRGSALSEEERNNIDLWEKGRALAQISGFYGWEVALATLHSFVDDATVKLLATNPADKDLVAARHANAYAADRIYNLFIQSVQDAIEHSRTTPSAIVQGVTAIKNLPPESI